jgi:RimJ/RimL family protein N-acetyltransferase
VHYSLEGGYRLRKPEQTDVDALHRFKNDPSVAALLLGTSTGWSRADLQRWVEAHCRASDEALWVIVDSEDRAIGHVGLYNIHAVHRSAEFAIVLDRSTWGKGIGIRATRAMVDFGFDELNLHRIELQVLADNDRAIAVYHKVGFREEGRLRRAVFKCARFHDVLVMAVMSDERVK